MNDKERLRLYRIHIDTFRQWLGHEFPMIDHALATLTETVDGNAGLNAGTPRDMEFCTINGLREQLRRQANSAPSGDSRAPVGWKLVPIEPTHEMVNALWDSLPPNAHFENCSPGGAIRSIIQAAPLPASQAASDAREIELHAAVYFAEEKLRLISKLLNEGHDFIDRGRTVEIFANQLAAILAKANGGA